MSSFVQAALRRFLSRLESRTLLSRDERQAVLQLSGHVIYAAQNHDLARPGDAISHATLVAEGVVGRFETLRSGARQIMALLIPGDLSDLHSVVSPSITWGLTPLGPATTIRVPHGQLKALAATYPNLAMAFWRDTTADASVLAKWISNIGRKDARARIAHLLCEIGVRMERADLGSRMAYQLALTQDQIGDATGLTAVHVNRTVKALKIDGLASIQNRQVRIADWRRLAKVAEFNPAYLLNGSDKDPSDPIVRIAS